MASVQPLPSTMIRLIVRLEASDINPSSFAALPKTMYRAGTSYCRIDEQPDAASGIHGSIIVNLPDIWMVNHLDHTARHQDPGEGFVFNMPMFVDADPKSASAAMLKPLEFGMELQYFKAKEAKTAPGPDIKGLATLAYTFVFGDTSLSMLTSGLPERPVVVGRKQGATRETYWYSSYDEVPFDPALFAKPAGKIEEVK